MLAAALVVAVVAAAGIGYAAVSQYTATTENSNNTIGSTYIVISQENGPVYATATLFDKVYFDTSTKYNATAQAVQTIYTPVYTHHNTTLAQSTFVQNPDPYAPGEGDTQYALISVPLTLKIAKTNSGATTADIDVTVTNFNKLDGIDYTMVIATSNSTVSTITATSNGVEDVAAAADNTGVWSFEGITLGSGNDGEITYVVFILVKGSINAEADTLGFNLAGGDSVFTFKVTAEPVPASDGPAPPANPEP